uniref:Uncharacterized protein LOC111138493 isoform X1 n=1 Tax=Crassostrea virginica TaxID=6565 RepID=A0A8B8F1U5_CRAVI|nr:uncharacterized protein LOC111138493 isoform X1 [Crassostrea virginica]
MASGNQDHIDPYNAGYDQLEQIPGASETTDQYITVHGQFPRFHEHHTADFGFPMNNAVANTLPVQPGIDAKREFNWLIPAILTTIICCSPCGIKAIREARQDLKRALIKNYAYVESSKNVKTCTFSKVPFIVREIIPGNKRICHGRCYWWTQEFLLCQNIYHNLNNIWNLPLDLHRLSYLQH